ncbi:uncharacterized protein L199_001445 [Kwoniella botswanensis]|uniref:uncharacterized protein n=1 Tax=Kwoniella botswanensis TaxID=1268659 RepID=UPI00315DD824
MTITIINTNQNPNEEYQINVRHPSYRIRPVNTDDIDGADGYGWNRIHHDSIPLLNDSNSLLKAPRFGNREVTLSMLYKSFGETSRRDLFTEGFVKEVSDTVDKYLESELSLLKIQRDIQKRKNDLWKNQNSIGKGKVSTANPRILQKLKKIREQRQEQLATDANLLEEEEKSFNRARYGLEMYYQSYFSICQDYFEQLHTLQSKSITSWLENSAGDPGQQGSEEEADLSQKTTDLENGLQRVENEEVNTGDAFQDDFDERYGIDEDVPVFGHEWSSLWDRHRHRDVQKGIDTPVSETGTNDTEVYPVNISSIDEDNVESGFEEDPKVTEQILRNRRYTTSGVSTALCLSGLLHSPYPYLGANR